ncbi:MAG: Gfo/Idh/MocA family oxidoreductase [Fibrobacter sp.]|uniref:Gfo/Idh/MocA family protein n=1 Tax=Fibrobacter sp. TaxID=35828 RepID=UPI0025BD1567|nr:Gfo/Idh/MocA family oxidoreductase [Fibrobacter sp.]MBR4785065.1 Gfo/Idh/MocA family oxidoreductase [Fibrobacter sp.]
MKRYKAILVGNGVMGGRHRARFEACGVEFVAVLDKECSDRSVLAASIAGKEFDFAVVTTPAVTHYGYAKFFLEQKIPVLVEKPLAITGEEAQELVDISLRNDTLLFVAQSECFNPLFLNFRKHFLLELNSLYVINSCDSELMRGNSPELSAKNVPAVRLEFRREHRYCPRCRDVDVSLDLLVHDLGLFFTLFRYEDVEVSSSIPAESCDRAGLCLKVVRGQYRGVTADFYVNRDSDVDVRTISVSYGRQGGSPESSYTVSLAHYLENGEIAHIPDSLENEHRFFLKLLDGACGDWGKRLAQTAADCVKMAASR